MVVVGSFLGFALLFLNNFLKNPGVFTSKCLPGAICILLGKGGCLKLVKEVKERNGVVFFCIFVDVYRIGESKMNTILNICAFCGLVQIHSQYPLFSLSYDPSCIHFRPSCPSYGSIRTSPPTYLRSISGHKKTENNLEMKGGYFNAEEEERPSTCCRASKSTTLKSEEMLARVRGAFSGRTQKPSAPKSG